MVSSRYDIPTVERIIVLLEQHEAVGFRMGDAIQIIKDEALPDPDEGMELRPEVVERLKGGHWGGAVDQGFGV